MLMASDDGDPLLGKDNEDSTENGSSLALRIKSFKDVEIRINDASSVAQVKQAVRNALGEEAKDRYLRLICKGRLLAPDTSSIREFAVRNGDVLHAVLAAAGVRGGQQAALARGISRRYRGTGVGAGGRAVRVNHDSEDDDDHDDSGDEEEARERLGFDRLRTTGLSRSEITAIRSYFSRNVDRFIQAHPEIAAESASGEMDSRRRRLLHEDAWMQAQGPTSNSDLTSTKTILLCGSIPKRRCSGRQLLALIEIFFGGSCLGSLWGSSCWFGSGCPRYRINKSWESSLEYSFQLALNFMKENSDDADFVED